MSPNDVMNAARGEGGLIAYSDQYIESLFWLWYNAGCPRGSAFRAIVQPDENGRVPNTTRLGMWRRQYGWDARAEDLNIKAQRKMEEIAVTARVQMFKRHAEVAEQMIETGIGYLEEQGIDTASSAIKAIIAGVDIEQKSRGVSDALMKIASMSNESLQATVAGLLSRMSSEEAKELDKEIIDVEIEETEKDEEDS